MKNSLAVSLTSLRRITKSLPVALLVIISSLSFPCLSLAESASLKEIKLESQTNGLVVKIYAQDDNDRLYMNIWDKNSKSFVANANQIPVNISQVKINSNDDWIKLLGIPAIVSAVVSAVATYIANTKLETLKSNLTAENNRNQETLRSNLTAANNTALETLKSNLTAANNTALETLRSNLTAENNTKLEMLKSNLTAENNRNQETLRNQYAKELEKYRQNLERQASTEERIKDEIIRWANPILSAVKDLEQRLKNIVDHQGFIALDNSQDNPNVQLDPNWSISYDYVISSTLYYFAKYFCWVCLLRQELNWMIFKSQTDKDEFFGLLDNVRDSLSRFPPPYSVPRDSTGRDLQVFSLQQQAIGELLIVSEDEVKGCMKYSDFKEKYAQEPLKSVLLPLRELLESVKPGERRWERLKAAKKAITNLREYCEKLLEVPHSQSP